MQQLKEYAKDNNLVYNTLCYHVKNGKYPNAKKLKDGKIVICTIEEILDPNNELYPLSYIPIKENKTNKNEQQNIPQEITITNMSILVDTINNAINVAKRLLTVISTNNTNFIDNDNTNLQKPKKTKLVTKTIKKTIIDEFGDPHEFEEEITEEVEANEECNQDNKEQPIDIINEEYIDNLKQKVNNMIKDFPDYELHKDITVDDNKELYNDL